MGMVGLDFAKWNEKTALSTTNGALFWMSPPSGPATRNKDIVVAYLTVPIGKTTARPSKAMAAFAGRSLKGDDYSVHVDFTPLIRIDTGGH